MIGYVGPFGDMNFGDYAMLVNDIMNINTKEGLLFTYNKAGVSAVIDEYFPTGDFNVIQVEVNDTYQPILGREYQVEFADETYMPLDIVERIENSIDVKEQLKRLDVLIVTGGGYFNKLWFARHRLYKSLSIMGTILLANEIGIPIFFLGNTFGPFDDQSETFRAFFSTLRNVKYASRDNYLSPSFMRSIGVSEEIEVIIDDLYGVTSDLFGRKRSIDLPAKYIVIELSSSLVEMEDLTEDIREFVDYFLEVHKIDVVFLPLDKEYGGEYQMSHLIKENVKVKTVFNFEKNSFLPIEVALEVVSNAEFVICQRYHLFLLALNNKIPCMQIVKDVLGDSRYYYCKSYGLLKMLIDDTYGEDFICKNVRHALKRVKNDFEEIIKSMSSRLTDVCKKEKLLHIEKMNYFKRILERGEGRNNV
ncbi:polysaccharide pyruvyl transferase WcaK-like protein [Lachnospiraceae bacterium PFB1-21]